MDDGDPVMKMYEAQAIVIEKEAEIEELRRKVEELERERLERNQGEPSSSSRDVRAAISTVQERSESDSRQQRGFRCYLDGVYRLNQLNRAREDWKSQCGIIRTDWIGRIERRLEEIVTRLERNEALNMRILETTSEDRIKGGNETILIMGGKRGFFENSDEMVILDRKTSTWKVLELKLPCGHSDGGCALLNGEIYIFGGNELKKKLYKLDSQQMRWIELAEMNEQRENIDNSSLVFQGCIWVFGGWKRYEGPLDTVEKYCPETNEWIEMPGMSQWRNRGAAAVCNEKIFVSGGHNGFYSGVGSVKCFDPTSGVWTPMVDMPGGRWGHSMISDGSSLFVMGGFDGVDNFNTAWLIRPSEENAAWEELQPMNEERSFCTAKSLCCSTNEYKKEIYAIGGNKRQPLDCVEIFDGERWREGPKLPYAYTSMSSVVIPPSLAETLLQYRI